MNCYYPVVVPIFAYWHQLNNKVELNLNLPQQLSLRKGLSPNSWVTFGTYLSGSMAFFRNSSPALPRDANYSSLELKTGPGLECRFGKIFMAGINGGIMTPVMSRIFERSETSNHYYINNRINTTPFVNVTISMLPAF